MRKAETIREMVSELTAQMGFLLVDITVSGTDRIVVYIDRTDRGVTVDDCAGLSRILEERLNREEADFELEVSSPGTERSLMLPEQYAKHTGRQVQLATAGGIEINGRLVAAADGIAVVESAEKVKDEQTGKKVSVLKRNEIMIANIKKAKIVFSK